MVRSRTDRTPEAEPLGAELEGLTTFGWDDRKGTQKGVRARDRARLQTPDPHLGVLVSASPAWILHPTLRTLNVTQARETVSLDLLLGQGPALLDPHHIRGPLVRIDPITDVGVDVPALVGVIHPDPSDAGIQ